jgi:hypothetical protein
MWLVSKVKGREIIGGKELLCVASLHHQLSKSTRNYLVLIATVVCLAGLLYGYWTRVDVKNYMLFWSILIAAVYGLILIFIFISTLRGYPLIITDKGIAVPMLVAEFWSDIESYSWEKFYGANRMLGPTIFSTREGTTLKLKTKGMLPRTQQGGHSILSTYLIFFSPEQIEAAEKIFNEHGIRKISRNMS